jgi:hypothetical protein
MNFELQCVICGEGFKFSKARGEMFIVQRQIKSQGVRLTYSSGLCLVENKFQGLGRSDDPTEASPA